MGILQRYVRLVAICLVVGTLVGTVLSAVAAPAATMDVTIQDFTFQPQSLTVPAGTTVVWTNLDTAPHTATSTEQSSESWTTEVLAQNESGSHTFNTPGTYSYFCAIHPEMTGTIVVEGNLHFLPFVNR